MHKPIFCENVLMQSLKTASVEWLNGTTRTDLAILTFVRSTTAQVRKNKFSTLVQWSLYVDDLFTPEFLENCSRTLFENFFVRIFRNCFKHFFIARERHFSCNIDFIYLSPDHCSDILFCK